MSRALSANRYYSTTPGDLPPGSKKRKSALTMRDIGRHLGISHVTVSLALRNSPQISESMRQKIQAAAVELGYMPNPNAAALGRLRSPGVAKAILGEMVWINCWADSQQLYRTKEYALYWKGAEEAALHNHYKLEEMTCGPLFPLERLYHVLKTRNISGILIPPHAQLPAGWHEFPWHEFSVVRIGYSVAHPAVPIVAANETQNGMLAFEAMRTLGHRQIGFVMEAPFSTRFEAGVLMAQSHVPESERIPFHILAEEPGVPPQAGSFSRWLAERRPTAILTNVRGMATRLRRLGHRVPESIGLASLNVHEAPSQAGLDPNPEKIGQAAVELLFGNLTFNERGTPPNGRIELLIEGKWVDGASLPELNSGGQLPPRRDEA